MLFFGFCASLDFTYQSFRMGPFLLSSLVYFLPNITITLMLTTYFGIMSGICCEFRRVNCILNELGNVEGHRQEDSTGEDWMVVYATSASFPKEFCKRTTRTIETSTRGIQRTSNVMGGNIVDKLRDIFIELEEFSTDVTNAFSLLIVTMFLGSFFVMTIQLYSLYKFVVEQNYKFATLAYTICWAILPTAKIFIVLYYNNSLVNEVRGISNWIWCVYVCVSFCLHAFFFMLFLDHDFWVPTWLLWL